MFSIASQGESCSRKRMKTSNSKQDETRVMMTRPSMPDLVIDRILPLLPTKAALRMSFLSKQWEGVWSLSPVLDFDECANKIHDEIMSYDKLEECHRNFIKSVQRYLAFREKNKTTQGFEKFRLRMTRYSGRDCTIVDKWLSYAFERSVKEIDLSFEIKKIDLCFEINMEKLFDHLYWLRSLPGSSITTLNLEFVGIPFVIEGIPSLPSLKNMSLKNVFFFESVALNNFLFHCPSIQSLSLTSCVFDDRYPIQFGSSSLRYLEVKQCNARVLEVQGENLEYFKLLSNHECFNHRVSIQKSFNLKYISIDSQYLATLEIRGRCPQSVEATIHAPRLETSTIVLDDSYKGESHNFQALREFLKVFDGTTEAVEIYLLDFKLIIFPEKFRETFLSPLPRLKQLKVFFKSDPPTTVTDVSNLNDSLTWIIASKRFDWSSLNEDIFFRCPYWPV